ncbi:unnamed protein product [Notodromas monacha]|uniref:lysozyme n=1 Tax=Notodromas monacha TaxID=399045 RepID=A0A7R9GEQ6_9CRUS|nr:unnamed protein product [Notodromas monacha]CAG0918517.1 unnamed protein product [Notodromas monacha]
MVRHVNTSAYFRVKGWENSHLTVEMARHKYESQRLHTFMLPAALRLNYVWGTMGKILISALLTVYLGSIGSDGRVFERCELARTLRDNYGFGRENLGDYDDLNLFVLGVCLAFYESSLDTSKRGGPNTDGSYDHGLFQINDGYWCYPPDQYADCNVACDNLRNDDITDDIACVRLIFQRHGFDAWYGWLNNCKGTNVEANWVADCNIG